MDLHKTHGRIATGPSGVNIPTFNTISRSLLSQGGRKARQQGHDARRVDICVIRDRDDGMERTEDVKALTPEGRRQVDHRMRPLFGELRSSPVKVQKRVRCVQFLEAAVVDSK